MIGEFFRRFMGIFTWLFVVAPWEQAIRVRGGRTTVLLGRGIYLRIPFYDMVFKQNVRRRMICCQPQTLTTRDGKIVTVSAAVGYVITDMMKMYQTLGNPNDIISIEASACVADYIGDTLLTGCSLTGLHDYVIERLNLGRYGLSGDEFQVLSFAHTPRTIRLIQGDISAWNRDDHIGMGEMMADKNQSS